MNIISTNQHKCWTQTFVILKHSCRLSFYFLPTEHPRKWAHRLCIVQIITRQLACNYCRMRKLILLSSLVCHQCKQCNTMWCFVELSCTAIVRRVTWDIAPCITTFRFMLWWRCKNFINWSKHVLFGFRYAGVHWTSQAAPSSSCRSAWSH